MSNVRRNMALLERLDQCTLDDLRSVANRLLAPGQVLERVDRAAELVCWCITNGRVEEAHRYLDEMGAA